MSFARIPYSEFKTALAADQVARVSVAETLAEGEIVQPGEDGKEERVLFRSSRVEDPKLTEQLLTQGVEIVGGALVRDCSEATAHTIHVEVRRLQ